MIWQTARREVKVETSLWPHNYKINKPLNPFTHSCVHNGSSHRENISLLSDYHVVTALWNAGLIFPFATASNQEASSHQTALSWLFFTLHLYIAHWVGLSPAILLINWLIIRIAFLMYVVHVIQGMIQINEGSELWPLEVGTLLWRLMLCLKQFSTGGPRQLDINHRHSCTAHPGSPVHHFKMLELELNMT